MLIAGFYNVVLGPYEKVVATILVTAVVAGGTYWLFDLQRYLRRLVIDRYDKDAHWRGLEIVYGIVGAPIISAISVCYLFLA